MHGEVINVSQDAITREKPQDKSSDKTPGAETTSSEPKGQEMNYAARVSLDRTQMQVDDKLVNLSPSMAVTVEIKTGMLHSWFCLGRRLANPPPPRHPLEPLRSQPGQAFMSSRAF